MIDSRLSYYSSRHNIVDNVKETEGKALRILERAADTVVASMEALGPQAAGAKAWAPRPLGPRPRAWGLGLGAWCFLWPSGGFWGLLVLSGAFLCFLVPSGAFWGPIGPPERPLRRKPS